MSHDREREVRALAKVLNTIPDLCATAEYTYDLATALMSKGVRAVTRGLPTGPWRTREWSPGGWYVVAAEGSFRARAFGPMRNSEAHAVRDALNGLAGNAGEPTT